MKIISEIIVRLFSGTPHFFTAIKYILLACTLITGLPAFFADSGMIFPDAWQPVILKVVSIASAVGAVVAQMTMTGDDKKAYDIK